MSTDAERIAILETEMKNMQASVTDMQADLRVIRDILIGAKGGWRTLMAVGGAAAAFGALLAKFIPLMMGK